MTKRSSAARFGADFVKPNQTQSNRIKAREPFVETKHRGFLSWKAFALGQFYADERRHGDVS